MSTAIPIGKIPGLPGPVARRLRALGLPQSTDLLRADLVKLTRVLGGATTLADVQGWRAVASLLELEGMKTSWAAALARRGITFSTGLCLRKLSAVRALFEQAVNAQEIPALPSDDVIAALLLDSMRMKSTGVLNVTVVDKQARPLRGARVVWGRAEARTDARGRARFVGLPLEKSFDLVVRKNGYLERAQKDVRPSAPQLLVGQRIELAKHAGRARAKRKLASQFAGDAIGPLDGRHFHLVTAKGRKLRRGDLVRWVATLKSGEVKLSSRFLDDDGERLIVRAWHLPRTALPADAALRDDFKVTRDGLVPIKLSTRRLARLRILRTILRGVKRPKNDAEFRRRMRETVRRLEKRAAFTRGF